MDVHITGLLITTDEVNFPNKITRVLADITTYGESNGQKISEVSSKNFALDLPTAENYKQFCDITNEDLLQWVNDSIEKHGLNQGSLTTETS